MLATNVINPNSTHLQKQLDAPMPWIGMYIAFASVVCSLAMAADLLRANRLCFPSIYFPLNATSTALLAIAVKLPLDLTTNMWTVTDRLAKLASLALLSTATANFMPSLGTMSDREIVINTIALGILDITVVVDDCIQIYQSRSFLHRRIMFVEEAFFIFLMLVSLALLISSCLMISAAKQYLDMKFNQLHNVFLKPESFEILRALTSNKLEDLFKKYFLMAETGSPQFVIVRSATCAASGVVCVLNALLLVEALVRMAVVHKRIGLNDAASSYSSSTKWILITQTIGVIVGTIAPACRWCVASSFCISASGSGNDNVKFVVEPYWTEKLMEAKEATLPLQIGHQSKFRKVFGCAKVFALGFLVRAQICIVITSKLILLIFVPMTIPFIRMFECITQREMQCRVNSIPRHVDTELESESNIRLHAIQLVGETMLPLYTLNQVYKQADKMIETGRRQKPRDLLKLLEQKLSRNFDGVTRFDSDQIPSLHSSEPPNSWSLPIVTLATIARALPNIEANKTDALLSRVQEGLVLVRLVEKCLNQDIPKITKAAQKTWKGVVEKKHPMWQQISLSELSEESNRYMDTLQKLGDEGERIVSEFKGKPMDCLTRNNPCNWPAEVIAANSMYRISKTMTLLQEGQGRDQNNNPRVGQENEFFDELGSMIADILGACLTNLFHVITIKCHGSSIEERMESMLEAAVILGQTEEMLEFLWQAEVPAGLQDPKQAGYIQEWRSRLTPTDGEIATDDVVITLVDDEEEEEAPIPLVDQGL